MKQIKFYTKALVLGIILFLNACNTFEYSPYDARVDEDVLATTSANLLAIQDININTDTFQFAFITDIHYQYDNLKAVIEDINEQKNIQFVIIGGDLTHYGLQKEFEFFHDTMKKLNKPYLTVIGNHDYLSNGEIVYNQMYGDFNYSFEFNDNKFVLFDNVVWESNKTPNFNWLSEQLINNKVFTNTFVVAHFPPYAGQFDEDLYRSIMQENNVQLSIHGHLHHYYYGNYYEDDVTYLTSPSLGNPTYTVINVYDDSCEIELIEL